MEEKYYVLYLFIDMDEHFFFIRPPFDSGLACNSLTELFVFAPGTIVLLAAPAMGLGDCVKSEDNDRESEMVREVRSWQSTRRPVLRVAQQSRADGRDG
jgi:hypothetical protein